MIMSGGNFCPRTERARRARVSKRRGILPRTKRQGEVMAIEMAIEMAIAGGWNGLKKK